MTYTPDSPHPQHPHHLECPRCGKHTVVTQGETRYVCLSCNWRRDLNYFQWDDFPILLATLLVTVFVLLALLPRQPQPEVLPSLPDEERPDGVFNPTTVG